MDSINRYSYPVNAGNPVDLWDTLLHLDFRPFEP
jgi:hypothetical protein